MYTPDDIDELRKTAAKVERQRSYVKRLEQRRDAQIRRLRRAGASAIELAQISGVSRGRMYAILDAREGVDIEGNAYELPGWEEREHVAWVLAFHEWHEHGEEGTPDDYFDLDAALDR